MKITNDDSTKTGSIGACCERTSAWAARFAAVMLVVIMVWCAAVAHLAFKI